MAMDWELDVHGEKVYLRLIEGNGTAVRLYGEDLVLERELVGELKK